VCSHRQRAPRFGHQGQTAQGQGGLVLDADAAMRSVATCYPFDPPDARSPLRYVVTARMLY